MTEPRWRKSSFSGNQGACVELASTMDQVRDGKNPGPAITVPTLRDLLRAARNGHLDR